MTNLFSWYILLNNKILRIREKVRTMDFMKVEDLQAVAFDMFETVNVDFLDQLKRDIKAAADAGNVSVKVSFYSLENKGMSIEHRETLVSYLRENGFKADYLSNELTVFWGVEKR